KEMNILIRQLASSTRCLLKPRTFWQRFASVLLFFGIPILMLDLSGGSIDWRELIKPSNRLDLMVYLAIGLVTVLFVAIVAHWFFRRQNDVHGKGQSRNQESNGS